MKFDEASIKLSGTPDVYTDFSALRELKTQAENKDPEAIIKTARQFEAIFLQMMLKGMREANQVFRSELFSSSDADMYEEMYHQQLALNLSETNTVGLSELIAKQLERSGKSPEEKADLEPTKSYSLEPYQTSLMRCPVTSSEPVPTSFFPDPEMTLTESAPLEAVSGQNTMWDRAEAFVKELLPYAKAVAEELGIDHRILLAQAAHETGWGRTLKPDAINLFGIKSTNDWQGEKMTQTTHEVVNHKSVKMEDSFRRYHSVAESFHDYANFLRGNPRYEGALKQTSNPVQFVKALQQAGYATDPNYADKVLGLFRSEIIQRAQ